MKQSQRVFGGIAILGLALFGLTSCNLWGGIDKPSGDAQLLSAARAAFDNGDFAKALNYYQQLSASDNDVKLAESAFVNLASAGANIANFAGAFGNGKNISVGPALATFAGEMLPFVGTANRTIIFNAFQSYQNINDINLRPLVQFMGSMAMAAIVLAEDIPASDNAYHIADVCPSTGTPPCGAGVLGVSQAAGATINGGGTMTGATVAEFQGTASLSMFNAAMRDVLTAVNNIGVSGSFGTGTSTLATTLTLANPVAAGFAAYRQTMVTAPPTGAGIGL
jgi:hypothetical protein